MALTAQQTRWLAHLSLIEQELSALTAYGSPIPDAMHEAASDLHTALTGSLDAQLLAATWLGEDERYRLEQEYDREWIEQCLTLARVEGRSSAERQRVA